MKNVVLFSAIVCVSLFASCKPSPRGLMADAYQAECMYRLCRECPEAVNAADSTDYRDEFERIYTSMSEHTRTAYKHYRSERMQQEQDAFNDMKSAQSEAAAMLSE